MDRSIVERAKRGDRQAFAQIAAASSDRLYAVAIRILRDADAAGEALQAALVSIWMDLPMLRDVDRFDAWSYRVVVRACHALLRQARRRPSAFEFLAGDAATGDSEGAVTMRDELERAFARLSNDHRAVLVLMYYRELTIPEIAAALGVSTGTVKSRLHYARNAMRAAIDAETRFVEEGRPA
jgi:RNA polymerase sigma-70 factor (ECF subfamily)